MRVYTYVPKFRGIFVSIVSKPRLQSQKELNASVWVYMYTYVYVTWYTGILLFSLTQVPSLGNFQVYRHRGTRQVSLTVWFHDLFVPRDMDLEDVDHEVPSTVLRRNLCRAEPSTTAGR